MKLEMVRNLGGSAGVVVEIDSRLDRRMRWAAAPINKKAIFSNVSNPSLKGDDITGVESFLLDEAAPAFGHHVALAAGPVRVTKPPRFSTAVFEV